MNPAAIQFIKTENVSTSAGQGQISDILLKLDRDRNKVASSAAAYDFNLKRVRLMSETEKIPDRMQGVVYWMSRDARVQDNWAMLFSQRIALKHRVGLHVCFCLVPKFLDATIRHFKFLLGGLRVVESDLKKLNIQFHLLRGKADDVLPEFVEKNSIGAVVTDFSPLRTPLSWVKSFKEKLNPSIPFWQVDAHNIVPMWVTSNELEYAAYTIRGKIKHHLPEFLTHFPPVISHPYPGTVKAEPVDWAAAEASLQVDQSVKEVSWAVPGTSAGLNYLQSFVANRLQLYATKRNEPTVKAQSNLSPWIHFGQISIQRCVLEVQEKRPKCPESVDGWVEQAVIRRELADNFCYFNPNYDNLNGADQWAKDTLNNHRKDKREYVYSLAQFEAARTHDDLWNASQIQMMREGKMHGFLRMYWAKKILEWSESPDDALSISIYLNDRYNLDGRDPNGYVGIMWSICGIHDHGFPERPVLGRIRWMSYEGCKRKFDVMSFVSRYGAKKYRYEGKK
ncbi:deoxyribodipyrimidine photo-lyase-like [Ischnura elegans]|uniref:deoxyribodipyrimidine photo-lyase-like n=1 Tax=Ischnura elegans TaxID=197161 RepID=UPI001ED8968C|nr:deoxyribodipyrimidine photo-lyase-like [Ischnura elegans]XP_046383945.1 deoxyribodipyrimidine photo-lyase-like [Ischnura elegans]